jgi:hypothetical protein
LRADLFRGGPLPVVDRSNVIRFPRRSEIATGAVKFRCPASGRAVDTGIRSDYFSLLRARRARLAGYCAHCGTHHDVRIGDTFVAASV